VAAIHPTIIARLKILPLHMVDFPSCWPNTIVSADSDRNVATGGIATVVPTRNERTACWLLKCKKPQDLDGDQDRQ
jgi:hypothetical protein